MGTGRYPEKSVGLRIWAVRHVSLRAMKVQPNMMRARARIAKKSSEEEHRADALAPSAEEGRGKLRKATGSRKQAMNRRSPNGGTRRTEGPSRWDEHIVPREGTRGTETSKYPEEEKERSIP